MGQERDRVRTQGAAWLRSTFWDEVEAEVEAIDWDDFMDFLEADREPIPVRPEFRNALRRRLRDFFRTRHST